MWEYQLYNIYTSPITTICILDLATQTIHSKRYSDSSFSFSKNQNNFFSSIIQFLPFGCVLGVLALFEVRRLDVGLFVVFNVYIENLGSL